MPELRAALGRGVILGAGATTPAPWADAPRVVIDDETLRGPATTLDVLHEMWANRKPVVLELRVDRDALRSPEIDDRPAHALTPSFEFARERLYFLVRANNYDAREDPPRWWHAEETNGVCADGGPRTAWLVPGRRVVHRFAIESGRTAPDIDPDASALHSLAADQRAAVLHPGGPARIMAPAGSGKTTVLTARFRHVVVERGYGPDNVCALAYNKRAQLEMLGRLADLSGAAHRKIRTLNSFGYDILKRAQPRVRVIEEPDVRRRIEPHVSVRHRTNTDALAPYLEALEEVQLGLRDPHRVEATRGDVDGFAAMYDHYRDGLVRDGAVDFDGQISGAVEVLLRDPALRAAVQRECRHLLVDEFQDLCPAHLLLVRLVAAPAFDVFGVGDDDQVIYGYKGATPDYLIRFADFFPGAEDHPLEVNYRCPPAVVDAATMLLAHNRRRVDKMIRAGRARVDGDNPLRVERIAGDELAPAAVDLIAERLAAGAAPEDIAVLCRVNAGLLPVQILAHERAISVTETVGEEFLGHTGVRAALAYLRIACAVRDNDQLRGGDIGEVVRRPSRRINSRAVDRIRNRRWTLATLRAHANRLPDQDADRLELFVAELERLGGVAKRQGTAAVLRAVRDDVGLGVAMGALDASKKGRDASHLDDLTALVAIASAHSDPSTFEAWLREHLRGARGDTSRQVGRVTLSTVHRVKGMEWPHVIVLGAHEGLMPHRLADDREEERRIFHVALTRCRRDVVVLADAVARVPFVDDLTTPPDPQQEQQPLPIAAAVVDSLLADALKQWRRERARSDGVPAYVVMHDATLNEIVAARPDSIVHLGRVAGIGPTKLDRYGADILAVLRGTSAGV
ncbi:MAG: ATP-dependent helicase [Actinomycetota bacterium]